MAGYRVQKQREGTRVTYWPDPRGPGHGVLRWGTVVQHLGDTLSIVWDDDDEAIEVWYAPDVKYQIDRGKLRLIPPPKPRRVKLPPEQLTCKVCGRPRSEKCGCPRQGAPKPEEWAKKQLTVVTKQDRIILSLEGGSSSTEEKGTNMTKAKPAKAEPVDDDEGGTQFSAKQAAIKLKTDARTLRKFLRQRSGLVGQGNRWLIDEADIDDLKAEFAAWGGSGKTDKPPKAVKPKTIKEVIADVDDDDKLSTLDDFYEDMDEEELFDV